MGEHELSGAQRAFECVEGVPMKFKPDTKRVRVMHLGVALAESVRSMILEERGHAPVHYFERDDVHMDRLEPSVHRTH